MTASTNAAANVAVKPDGAAVAGRHETLAARSLCSTSVCYSNDDEFQGQFLLFVVVRNQDTLFVTVTRKGKLWQGECHGTAVYRRQ